MHTVTHLFQEKKNISGPPQLSKIHPSSETHLEVLCANIAVFFFFNILELSVVATKKCIHGCFFLSFFQN